MARIQLGSIVSDIRGSIGGTTFQMSGHGLVAHNKKRSCNPNTRAQSSIRNLFPQLHVLWQSLDNPGRQLWQTWAEFQNLKIVNFAKTGSYGQQAFFQMNFYLLELGLPTTPTPYFAPNTSQIINPYLLATEDGLHFNLDSAVDPTTYQVRLLASAKVRDTVNYPQTTLRYIPLTFAADNRWKMDPAWHHIFGQNWAIGDSMFLSITVIDTAYFNFSNTLTSKFTILSNPPLLSSSRIITTKKTS